MKAINLGHDTDTVAAIAGGLAGLYYGYTNIPEEWLEKIEKKNGQNQKMDMALIFVLLIMIKKY